MRVGRKELTLLKEDIRDEGKIVNAFGRIEVEVRGGVDSGVLLALVELLLRLDPRVPKKLNAPVSTIFREAIIVSMSQS